MLNNKIYPFQVENGGHLCKASKLIPDGPGGHSSEVRHKRSELFIELQPSQLQNYKQEQNVNYIKMHLYTFYLYPIFT